MNFPFLIWLLAWLPFLVRVYFLTCYLSLPSLSILLVLILHPVLLLLLFNFTLFHFYALSDFLYVYLSCETGSFFSVYHVYTVYIYEIFCEWRMMMCIPRPANLIILYDPWTEADHHSWFGKFTPYHPILKLSRGFLMSPTCRNISRKGTGSARRTTPMGILKWPLVPFPSRAQQTRKDLGGHNLQKPPTGTNQRSTLTDCTDRWDWG